MIRRSLYLVLAALGATAAWNLAPQTESYFLPVLTDVYLVPWDPKRPDVLVDRQLDRICWRQHIHKIRDASNRRWPITFIMQDGTRYFTGPLDGRTGKSFASKDVYQGGFEGIVPICADYPDDIDWNQAFDIESYGQYEPIHHLWRVDQAPFVIHVPAVVGDKP